MPSPFTHLGYYRFCGQDVVRSFVRSYCKVFIPVPAVNQCVHVVAQCLTEKGYELARVSLVDSDGNCVMDDLVKPQDRILNYLTRYTHTYACTHTHTHTDGYC